MCGLNCKYSVNKLLTGASGFEKNHFLGYIIIEVIYYDLHNG